MPKTTTATDPLRFEDWLSRSNPGDRCIYYTGYLYVDRCWAHSHLKGEEVLAARGRVAAANRAWRSSNEGLVALTQKKIGDMKYEYIATRVE